MSVARITFIEYQEDHGYIYDVRSDERLKSGDELDGLEINVMMEKISCCFGCSCPDGEHKRYRCTITTKTQPKSDRVTVIKRKE